MRSLYQSILQLHNYKGQGEAWEAHTWPNLPSTLFSFPQYFKMTPVSAGTQYIVIVRFPGQLQMSV